MSSYGSIWVRISDREGDLSRLAEVYGRLRLSPDKEFACIEEDAKDGEVPADALAEISERYGEAIFMFVQTTVDFFVYSHWRDGVLARELSYTADDGWIGVSGEAEEWEGRRFFTLEQLETQIEYLDLERTPRDERDEKKLAEAMRLAEKARGVWARSAIEKGELYPMTAAADVYSFLAGEFKLQEPHDSRGT